MQLKSCTVSFHLGNGSFFMIVLTSLQRLSEVLENLLHSSPDWRNVVAQKWLIWCCKVSFFLSPSDGKQWMCYEYKMHIMEFISRPPDGTKAFKATNTPPHLMAVYSASQEVLFTFICGYSVETWTLSFTSADFIV